MSTLLPIVANRASCRRVASSRRGQASVLLAGLVVVTVALSVALVGVLRLRADRLQAQRIADAASLGAVQALLDGRRAGEVRRSVERYVDGSARGARVPLFTVDLVSGAVTVQVRLRPTEIGLPSLLGPRPRSLAAMAIARAAPGEADPAITSPSGSVDVGSASGGLATVAGGSGSAALVVSRLPDGTDLTVLPHGVPVVYRPLIEAAAQERALPVALLAAQLAQESGFDPRSLSPVGAAGIAQFMPGTWSGSWNPWRSRSPYEAAFAIRAQSLYMRDLLFAFRRDVARALAAYNAGSGRVTGPASSWPLETQAYVARILRMLRVHDVSQQVTAGALLVDAVPRLRG